MASVVDKLKKRKESKTEWSKTGSFLNKPDRGWIFPDEQLAPSAGICYGVRYIGCLEVKESMRSLDFDTRTALAREAISRVSEAAGLKTASKRKKVDKKIGRMLGDTPCMQFAGSNVNLTITVDSIDLMIMESGEVIANHVMPGISFASGGDAETLDFVAYVAKDDINGRACHVLECGGGLSEDVITTIGQAFELRFKEYLKKQPKPVILPDSICFGCSKEPSHRDGSFEYPQHMIRLRNKKIIFLVCKMETLDFVAYGAKDDINGRACHVLECGGGLSEDVITTIGQAFELRFKEYLKKQPKPVILPDRMEHSINDGDAWGDHEENDYFNDNPNARPPSPPQRVPSEYAFPPSNLPVSDGVYSSVSEPGDTFVYDTPREQPLIDFSDGGGNVYDNSEKTETSFNQDLLVNALEAEEPGLYDNPKATNQSPTTNGSLDPFDMGKSGRPPDEEPFNASLNGNVEGENPPLAKGPTHDPNASSGESTKRITPLFEEWFHGNLNRKEAEKLLANDGDFLVRQSSGDSEQYVLSGRQNGIIKHLLLVDPEGVVRTKEHTFDSVPHLINFHRSQNIPIVSQESELHLKTPISNKFTAC